MPQDTKNPSLILAGAIALVLGSVLLVGVDYTETRERASMVPLNEQRISAVEITMREASREQTAATKELSRAVQDLRETIAELRAHTQQ